MIHGHSSAKKLEITHYARNLFFQTFFNEKSITDFLKFSKFTSIEK